MYQSDLLGVAAVYIYVAVLHHIYRKSVFEEIPGAEQEIPAYHDWEYRIHPALVCDQGDHGVCRRWPVHPVYVSHEPVFTDQVDAGENL